DKLVIGDPLSGDESQDRVAEDVRVALVRLEPAPLLDVRVEVLLAQVMVRPGDEAPALAELADDVAEDRLAAAADRHADAVRREPERLVAPTEDVPEPVRGDAPRRLGHQLDGD